MHEDFIIHTDVSMIRYTFGMWKPPKTTTTGLVTSFSIITALELEDVTLLVILTHHDGIDYSIKLQQFLKM